MKEWEEERENHASARTERDAVSVAHAHARARSKVRKTNSKVRKTNSIRTHGWYIKLPFIIRAEANNAPTAYNHCTGMVVTSGDGGHICKLQSRRDS